MTLVARHRLSCVPLLRSRAAGRRARGLVGGAGSALAGALLALVLLVAGAPAAHRSADTPRVAATHVVADGGAPSLHVVADGGAPSLHVVAGSLPGAVPQARRASGGNAPVWAAESGRAGVASTARAAAPAPPASGPHSVVAAGFDATAPPVA